MQRHEDLTKGQYIWCCQKPYLKNTLVNKEKDILLLESNHKNELSEKDKQSLINESKYKDKLAEKDIQILQSLHREELLKKDIEILQIKNDMLSMKLEMQKAK